MNALMIDFILHLDIHLQEGLAALGPWTYVILFTIVFCETGLVVTPFLPGDSLLFALGALAATRPEALSVWILAATLSSAAVLGDNVNYLVGRHFGPKVFRKDTGWFLNRNHLISTQQFYHRHGGKTIFLAKFLPIFRTFAPFVAGVGKMRYARFATFNVSSGICWVFSLLFAGYFFGNIPLVKDNFELVVIGIIAVSMAPLVLRLTRSWLKKSDRLADRSI
jgi:membrane-associated protein